MVVEGGPMKYWIDYVDVCEIEAYQLLGEISRREGVPDGTKVSGFRQTDTLPFQFPLKNR